ncbi:MAG: hypothetical protein FJW31_11545 [Acidobacteria bacterium]|nr:hypothetical protein [Acidobacteriota bacterium]
MATRPPKLKAALASPLRPPEAAAHVCLEVTDNSTSRYSATEFFGLRKLRDPAGAAARMATQFIEMNRRITQRLGVGIEAAYDGRSVDLLLHAGNSVGAVPLASPSSARPDYGLIVRPRFPWAGIGPMLATMGWRVTPTPLRLPLLLRSERRVPPWVLSATVLLRLEALLNSLDRRFEMVSENRSTPKGQVDWAHYATRSLAHAQPLAVPCSFPDLRDDRQMRGAIRSALEKQSQSSSTQVAHGAVVHRLIEWASGLLRLVGPVPALPPSAARLQAWLQRPLRSTAFLDGLQAIEWTVDDRGLAGLSDLDGLPWAMPMDKFFEAWVETVAYAVARQTGGLLRTGRQGHTERALNWQPRFLGSQRLLIPDVCLEWGDFTVLIIDAKYKRHFEEFSERGWRAAEDELRERHRQDLLQVLAYANLCKTLRVAACLVYPCAVETWRPLVARGGALHRATIPAAGCAISVWLTAMPMTGSVNESAVHLTRYVQVERAHPASGPHYGN